MSKPKKTQEIQKKKIKQLKARLRKAIIRIRKLKRRNCALQRIRPPPGGPSNTTPESSGSLTSRPSTDSHAALSRSDLNLIPIRLKSRPPPQITKSSELTEFHYFPYLPFEIRVPIWKLAVDTAPDRRVILRDGPLEYSEPNRPNALPWAQISSSARIPALLHTCHLFRHQARERWELSMAVYPEHVRRVYIDVATDSIFFPSLTLLWLWQERGDQREVLRIAAESKVFVLCEGKISRRCYTGSIIDLEEFNPASNDDGNY
ncbi:hypothetical protein VE04_05198 [Pseudogymnoascus sp. 24MN13]|nr:hypothetical protein VE04_05198 [Pseudogymnoascus sp. 24MN13]